MRVFADSCITWKHANGFQAEQGSVPAAIRRHHGHHALHGRRPKDCPQRLFNVSAREGYECLLHDVDAFIHGKKIFDSFLVDNEYCHSGGKDNTLRIVSEARALARASSGVSFDYPEEISRRFTQIHADQNEQTAFGFICANPRSSAAYLLLSMPLVWLRWTTLKKSAADLRRYSRIRTNRTAFGFICAIRVHPRPICCHRCPP